MSRTGDHHASDFGLLVPEHRHRPGNMVVVGDEIDLVPGQHLIVRRRHQRGVAAVYPHHHDIQVREDAGELAQRRVDHRAVIAAAQRDGPHHAVGERDGIGGAGHQQAAHDRPRDLHLGRDDHVDRHVVPAEQIGPDLLQIGLGAYAGDLGRHLEQRMRDLAGHHVDLVGLGDRDDHVAVAGRRTLQHIGMGGEADQRADIERVADLARQVFGPVDHRHVIAFGGKLACDVVSDLAGAADDHLHGSSFRRSGEARLGRAPSPTCPPAPHRES